MHKKKFEKFYNEAVELEPVIFECVQKYFDGDNEKLNVMNLSLDIYLEWNYFGEEFMSKERLEMRPGYICVLFIQIRKSSDPAQDSDLECITFYMPITRMRKTLLLGRNIFEYYPQQYFFEGLRDIKRTIDEVLEKGYDVVFNRVKAESKY